MELQFPVSSSASKASQCRGCTTLARARMREQAASDKPVAASVTACLSSEPPTTPTQAITGGTHSFASAISRHVEFGDGSVGHAVDRCYATDLCALISFADGDQLAIYSEGAARCKPYVLYFNRTNGGRTIYGFSRDLERDRLCRDQPIARCVARPAQGLRAPVGS